jgi:demethylmenaquinone methyltransferase/2-methoxy-6-polyprenyl-1,4-benzoquinol methylase/phosphoethanolamine N-methyltransferase
MIRYWARFYDAATMLLSFGKAPAIRRQTLELAQLASGEKVLDIGCGTGTLAIAARAEVGAEGEVHGIDASPEMIDVAVRKVGKEGADVRFQVGLIEGIPFPDDHFDIVLSSLMLHHLPEDLQRSGLAEIRRVLKPGGRFLVVEFAGQSHSVLGHLMTVLGHKTDQSNLQELTKLLEGAGFASVEALQTKYKELAFVRAKSAEAR